MSKRPKSTAATRPADKIAAGLREAIRVIRLINAVHGVVGFVMTEQESVAVLAILDAP
jgi:hypothetical protein